MAKQPTSRGIGTGTAQVYDTSRIGDAMNRLSGIVAEKDRIHYESQQKAQEKKDKAIAELKGEFKDYDTSKLMLADVPEFQAKVKNLHNKYSGKWGKILNADPELSNAYISDVDEIKRYIARSVDSKPKAQKFMEEIQGNPLYSEEFKANYIDRATSGGYSYDKDLREGGLTRDVPRGDFMNNINELFVDKGDELYNVNKNTYVGKDGGQYSEDSKIWKSDEEAFPKFKTTITSDIEMMTDINLKYADLPEDQRIKAAYDDYKKSTETYQKNVVSKAAPEKKPETPGITSAGYSSTPFKVGGKEGFTVANPKKAMTPITLTVKGDKGKPERTVTVIPSEFVKTKNGWGIRGSAIKQAWVNLSKEEQSKYDSKEEYYETASGDLIEIPATDNVKSKVKDQYGIPKDWDSHLNNVKGIGSEDDDPLGLF